MSQAVVADSSPINYLILIGGIDLLPRLFSDVLIPAAVQRELTCADTPTAVRAWIAQPPPWFSVVSPQKCGPAYGLDDGESEAIQLALELGIPSLLIDERNGYHIATALGLRPVGLLGIVELCAKKQWISFDDYISRLRSTTFRFSEELIVDARARLSREQK